MSKFESTPSPPTPEASPPLEAAPPRWRSPLERRSQDEAHNQELAEREQAVNDLLSTPLSQTERGKELLQGVAVDTHMELVMREATQQAPPDLITKYFPKGKESKEYREYSTAVDNLFQKPISPAEYLRDAEHKRDLTSVGHFKKLSAMTLEKVVPSGANKSWENLSPEEKITVRVAESLNIMADAAEMNIRLAKPELREKLNQHVEKGGLDALRNQYQRFKSYAANEDIPESVKKQLEDTRAMLLLTYPDLEQTRVKPRSLKATGQEAEAAVQAALTSPKIEQQPADPTAEAKPPTVEKPAVSRRPDVLTAQGIPSETKKEAATTLPETEAQPTVEKRREDEQYLSHSELQERSTPEMLDYIKTIQNRIQRQRGNVAYEQADQIFQGLREGRTLNPESQKIFYDALQRHQLADPQREQDRQRYLGILENELGYGAAQVGGLLDQRISKVTERFFARANVVGGLRGLLAMWRGKTDYRVWQSRADTIQSMREAALDQGLHETMSALLKRYADELELINTRDMVERSRFVDDRQQEMARGQESVQTAQAARRRKKRLKRGNNPKRKLQRMVNRVRAGRVAEQKEEKETAS